VHVFPAILALAFVAYVLFHRHHYRQRRRAGSGIWESLPGPFGTRLRISKRIHPAHIALGFCAFIGVVFAAGLALGGHL
jgi:hypothetical protein